MISLRNFSNLFLPNGQESDASPVHAEDVVVKDGRGVGPIAVVLGSRDPCIRLTRVVLRGMSPEVPPETSNGMTQPHNRHNAL